MTTFREEHQDQSYKYILEYIIYNQRLQSLQMCIRNLEHEREEEMRIYGYISYEAANYICNLSEEVNAPMLFETFNIFLEQLKTKLTENYTSE